MKKLFKQSILVLAVLLFGLSSCNSDDIPIIDTSDYKTLSLRISSDIATRGISESVPDGTPVVFNTGTLFLVNSDGVIVRHFNIVPRGQATVGSNISRADFDSQVTIDNIAGQVVEAVVVANTSGNNTAGSISAVGERVIDIVSQHDVTNVNLFGRAMFQPTGFIHPITGNNVYETNILLRPTVARFEIADITGAGQIESFTIEGIFIDRYYRQAQVGGTILATLGNFISNGQDPDLFVYGSTVYPSTLTPALFDWGVWSGSRNTSLTVAPDNMGNVWAYQLFAQTDASADATTVPSIVIRMRDVTLRDGTTIQGARFLTIRGILTQSGVLQGIRSGIVYRFPAGEIVFTERELSPRPNENPIDARVTVSLANWGEEIVSQPCAIDDSYWVDREGNVHFFSSCNTSLEGFSNRGNSGNWYLLGINGENVHSQNVVKISFGNSWRNHTVIGDNFLSSMWHLRYVDLSGFENVITIGNGFMANSIGSGHGLTMPIEHIDLTPLSNVTTIGNQFFYGLRAIRSIDLSPLGNVTTIGDRFFEFNRLNSLHLSGLENVRTIGGCFFCRSAEMTSADISSLHSLERIGWSFFGSRFGLMTVTIGNVDWTQINSVDWNGNPSYFVGFSDPNNQGFHNNPLGRVIATTFDGGTVFRDLFSNISNWTVVVQP